MIRYGHRILSLLMLLIFMGSTSQARHACSVATPLPAQDHHSESQDHDAPHTDECRMFAPCNVTAAPQLGTYEMGTSSVLTRYALPVIAGYHPPVLIRETPPPRA